MFQETHIMQKFDSDFYGSNLKISLVSYLRCEMNFTSLDDLIVQIKQDIQNAEQILESNDSQKVKVDPYFSVKML